MKTILPIIGFKTTGFNPEFQHKNGIGKIRKNVLKYASLVWRSRFWHILTNVSGSGAYISKLIFASNPCAQANRFEYHEPYNQKETNFGVT